MQQLVFFLVFPIAGQLSTIKVSSFKYCMFNTVKIIISMRKRSGIASIQFPLTYWKRSLFKPKKDFEFKMLGK